MSARALLLTSLVFALACGDDDGGVDAGTDTGTTDDAGADASVDAGPACTFTDRADPIADPARYTPRWAFEPWISKDISDREDTESFIAGFLEREIPVGALVLDSPWETNYNTLIPNPERYGDFPSLVSELDAQGIKLVLWTTQMINRTSLDLEEGGDVYRGAAPNYAEGFDCDFFVNGGRSYSWWKGTGSAIDFFDPGARAWWYQQQDALLALGLGGWKLDFGESYIRDEPNSYDDEIDTFDGVKTLQEYSEEYYADFLRYGVQQNGREFVTMVRAYDVSYDIPARFYARPEHAPVVWVGDNHRNWEGLIDALDHSFRSVEAGYVVVGSDIGGYLDRDQNDLVGMPIPFDEEVFARWVAWSGWMPFFQLHGRANLEPWNISAEAVLYYRYWATLHHEMVPYWFSLAQEAYAGGPNIIDPIGDDLAAWTDDWSYLVGGSVLVAPVLEAGGVRDVTLPEGTWYDWWSEERVEGGTTLTDYAGATAIDRIPIFVREGTILPMHVDNAHTGFGSASSADFLTIAAWLPQSGGESTFTLHHGDEDDSTSTITATPIGVQVSPGAGALALRLQVPVSPISAVVDVLVDGRAPTRHATRADFDAADEGWFLETTGDPSRVWVRTPAADGARDIHVVVRP